MSFKEFAVYAVARMFCLIIAACYLMLVAGLPSWAVSAFFDGAMIGVVAGLLICYTHYCWVEEGSLWGWLMLVRVPSPVSVPVSVTFSINNKHLIRFLGK